MYRIGVFAAGAACVGALVHFTAAAASGDARSEFIDVWVYCAVVVAAAVACWARARTRGATDRLPWTLIAVGTTLWAVAEIYWSAYVAPVKPEPYPTLADPLYILSYPFWAVGIMLMVRGGVGRVRAGIALDGAIAAFGTAALGAALLGPALGDFGRRNLSRTIVDAAYPVMDVVIIAALGAAVATLGLRRAWVLLALGFLAVSGADVVYLHQDATTGYVEGTLVDSTWLVGAALVALAAVQRPRVEGSAARGHSVIVPIAASLVATTILVVDHYDPTNGGAVLLAAATLGAATARLAFAFAENRTLLAGARRESFTDPLTGLGNRRLLMRDVNRALEQATVEGKRFVFAIYDLDGFKSYNDTYGHPAGDMLLRRMGIALTGAISGHGRAYRLGGDEFCILAPLDGVRAQSVVAAATAALREDGEGFVVTASCGQAVLPDEARTQSDTLRLADRRLYQDKGRSDRSFGPQARDLLMGVLREREPDLHAHVQGVGALALALGREAGLEPEDLDVLHRAADLHDIGKMAIPDEILTKPGPLDEDEWRLMKTHTLIGERMLNVAPALLPVGRLVRFSHERWDGTGYPDGLAGEEIPIGARIIAICDAFEAMIEPRPYREPLTVDEALAELRRNAGTQFDPELVRIFCGAVAPAAALSK